ncbi:plasma membrane proteolipid 3 [Trichophyton rubrum D6]|uniref:Plasma membrane proteolipid 3 n=2 Tax=Trichophyton TaxID=5550 RepID=A0A022VNP6_TRIRU|nr:plasma membrane proteolipid 3 [Trichophyton rubrum MR850]EZF36625.1 plasma membrane proteolipid 3 [Trichophyton rubrum CBS 100081]EZF47388.1 plasma membrane proteolipid 3 [Trichophyton rubrum CBS 288.86]EZF79277.1 plasma membrane proteolipid 3 [Trichophyton rubrum MR1448]EZF90250.1 plasma membrane proteolipid 3 [Trichophyton rubrum MR1459]EZG11474.1 plasma membrane proteolipid 3 [Trichophyton rubrum CBS 202.88]KDB28394.1 plasma membrane proteolipid 3 [Trichophyton rubrum D6]
MAFTASDICKIILAIILPPIGVFLERGCGADLLINICLTILGYIPGIIHALSVSLRPIQDNNNNNNIKPSIKLTQL